MGIAHLQDLKYFGDYYSDPDHSLIKLPSIKDLRGIPEKDVFSYKLFGDVNEEIKVVF